MNTKSVLRFGRLSALLGLILTLVGGSSSLFFGHVSAAPRVLNRSLTIGTTEPGASTDYTFRWRWPTNSSVGSIRFLLCADAYVEDTCSVTPSGDYSSAILTSQSGSLGGFAISSQDTDEILLSRGVAGATGTGQYTFVFEDVINPAATDHRFFVQIFTYSSTDGTGVANHASAVASAITEPIVINTEVPQILYFCAALWVTDWCYDVGGNFIDYGDLSSDTGHAAVSQFGAATNAENGYVVTINGNTMAAGNKLIPALAVRTPNTPGTGQFGINLRANTNPANGQDAFGGGIGVVSAEYDVPDEFRYVDGDVVASAVTGTMFNTYTVTYILNIPPDQPSGIYNTTIAYICTAAF